MTPHTPTFKAVIFDLDGTLLDTLADISSSMNRALVRLGFYEHPMADYRYFVGDGMHTLARRVLPEGFRDEASVIRCVALMREEYGIHWADKTVPYPGVLDTLNALEARELKLGILSNKPDDFSKAVVAKFFPRTHFQVIAGAKPNVPIKPHPAGALTTAELLGVAPSECIFVGDTNVDIETAVNAGMFPAGALWGFRTAKELSDAGARKLLEKPADLFTIL